jgi:hypothetical protein
MALLTVTLVDTRENILACGWLRHVACYLDDALFYFTYGDGRFGCHPTDRFPPA